MTKITEEMIGKVIKAKVTFVADIVVQSIDYSNGNTIMKVIGLAEGSVLNVDTSNIVGIDLRQDDNDDSSSKITSEMKKEYLEHAGNVCLFCGRGNISADGMEVDGDEAWNNVRCKDCKESWKDIYKLIDAIEEE